MEDLNQYIGLSNMMILATNDQEGNPYTSNVYFGYNPDNYIFYFISRITREHSQHILKNPNIAWSVVDTNRYSSSDKDKKALQFQGIATLLEGTDGMKKYEQFYEQKIGFKNFPQEHHVFECKPTRAKIWDESLYGGNGKIIKF